jgi:LmbE family N-acetylglucosaminyl deacetylase/uncharacterized coiled-coil protein SlyX
METWYTPYQASALPAAARVLVLAPHPDDEVFGCGGAIALYRQAGVEVRVVVLTDGAVQAVETADRQRITNERQKETVAALSLLGVAQAQFWAFPDRGLHAADAALIDRVVDALDGVDLVFAPSPFEVHPDHLAVARLLLRALPLLQTRVGNTPQLMFYEVGALLAPNFLLDISAVWPMKQQAMQCFVSQLSQQDYARHIAGLNAYRTYTLSPEVTHAEGYLSISAAEAQTLDSGSLMGAARSAERLPADLDRLLEAADAGAEAMRLQLRSAQVNHAEQAEIIKGLNEQLMASRQEREAFQAKVIGGLKAEIHDLNAQRDRFDQQIRDLKERNFGLNEQMYGLNGQIEDLKDQLMSSRRDVEFLQTSLDAVTAEYQAVLSSRTWRVVSWLSRLLGRVHS